MGTKTIRLDESVYERLQEVKREDETFSEAVERLLPDGSLLELAGIYTESERDVVEDRLAEKYARSKDTLRTEIEQDQ